MESVDSILKYSNLGVESSIRILHSHWPNPPVGTSETPSFLVRLRVRTDEKVRLFGPA